MKPNSTSMRIARKAAIKILDSNPKCTEEHFKDIRHLLNDNTAPTQNKQSSGVKLTSYTNLYQLQRIYVNEITRGLPLQIRVPEPNSDEIYSYDDMYRLIIRSIRGGIK